MRFSTDRVEGAGLSTSTACALSLIGAGVLAGSTMLTWVSAEARTATVSYTLLDMPAAVAVLGLGVVLITGGAAAGLAGRDGGLELASVAALAMAVFSGALLLLAESFATLVLGGGASAALQHLGLGAGAGAGPWVALGTAIAIATVTIDPVWQRVSAAVRLSMDRGPGAVGALCALLLALLVLVQLRQVAWVSGGAIFGELTPRADSLPCIGPATFAATWLLVAGLFLVCVERIEIGALTLAFAGWLVSFCAAVVIIVPGALADTPLQGEHATTAAWCAYGLGIGIAGAAGAFLWTTGAWV